MVVGHAFDRIIAWEWYCERLPGRRRERIAGFGGFFHTQGSDTGSLNVDLSPQLLPNAGLAARIPTSD